jgi:uncharacterized protein
LASIEPVKTALAVSIDKKMHGETNLSVLIHNMQPVLNDGLYVFCTVPSIETVDFDRIILLFKENEGFTLIVEKAYADEKGFTYEGEFAWISLLVHSALDAVGLTAAFSKALAENNISCNVVAGYYHDHIFVQADLAQKAVAVLQNLAKNVNYT